ncbi:MAG TPA: histidine kinase dimerization/phospho-acceptor domain-containing protein [Longimicrobiales bacterium]
MDEARWAHALQLVRAVRHDANNPLTAALGHVQLLLDDPAITDPEVRETLGVVESELHRLADVLRRLSAFRELAGAGGADAEESP